MVVALFHWPTMIVLSNTGASVDLLLRKGAAFVKTFTLETSAGTPIDLTGYTFASQIRTQAGVLSATLTCTIINAGQGTFSISLGAPAIAALTVGTRYVWDLEYTNNSATAELMRGYVDIVNEVTLP